ncbi:MAG: RNA polymerase sigma factor [Hyphomicrobiaceae bacterium]
MTDRSWMSSVLTAARPKAVAALLRYFRDLDLAEEAFQEACLKALATWPRNGPPRDPAAWLIMVARNSGIDHARRSRRHTPLPDDDVSISDLSDQEGPTVERIDAADYRDDILRLMFICCHDELPATQQIALALRIVSGLSVAQIARAFLVSDAAMEQRITRAKARVAKAAQSFETPGPAERARRQAAVAAMIYLVFNEGYSAASVETAEKGALADEAIRLARLLLQLFPAEPEVMGLLALLLLQHARAPARLDANGDAVLLDRQDRKLWRRPLIDEGLALVDKAMRHNRPGPYQVQAAIAALHSRAPTADETDWPQIELLYGALERLAPSPVITLNRAVAVAKTKGPGAALAMIEALSGPLANYFYFHGARGSFLAEAGRNAEAREAFGRAIALARSPAEAAHIRRELDRLSEAGRPAAAIRE